MNIWTRFKRYITQADFEESVSQAIKEIDEEHVEILCEAEDDINTKGSNAGIADCYAELRRLRALVETGR